MSDFDGDTPGELYLKMLKDCSPHAPDYPGASEEYMRRLRKHQQGGQQPQDTEVEDDEGGVTYE